MAFGITQLEREELSGRRRGNESHEKAYLILRKQLSIFITMCNPSAFRLLTHLSNSATCEITASNLWLSLQAREFAPVQSEDT